MPRRLSSLDLDAHTWHGYKTGMACGLVVEPPTPGVPPLRVIYDQAEWEAAIAAGEACPDCVARRPQVVAYEDSFLANC